MIRIGRVLFYVLAPAMLASCFFAGSGDESQSRVNPILQFQSDREDLALPSLQVGQHVYSDVALRLARDGAWQLKSIGPIRPLVLGESAQAVLRAPADAVLNMDWRPADATITIPRMHIDAKVFGNVTLRLTGNKWFWGDALQSGNDLQDAHELKALTLADYQANSDLAATETHHTVLHSHPAGGMQRFPLQLGAKAYKFCMDRQDEGADSVRLLDPAGKVVVSLKAGDACIDIKLDAGLYTMEYVYGAGGATRTVFIRPAAALPNPPSASLAALGAQDPAYPEYWAIYVPEKPPYPDGFLSFNGTEDYLESSAGCIGSIDAAAQLGPYSRPGDSTTYKLFNSKNFFLIARDSNGTPTGLSYPLFCSTAVASTFGLWMKNSYPFPSLLLFFPSLTESTSHFFSKDDATSSFLNIVNFSSESQFRLAWLPEWDMYLSFNGDGHVAHPILGIDDQKNLAELVSQFRSNFLRIVGWESYRKGILAYAIDAHMPDTFQVGFRYFPNGLPPPKPNQAWFPESGEAALFSGPGCTGAVMIAKDFGMESLDFPALPSSVQLGPDTAVTFYSKNDYNGNFLSMSTSGSASRCANTGSEFSQWPAASMQISNIATILIQTGICEHCNLAGIDLSDQAISLKGVKLQYTNLTGASFANSNLTQADLRNTILQGAILSNANLEAANLCQAALNPGAFGDAAQLTGAHLKNVNLSGANLDRANFRYASFYSSTQGSCQSSCSDTYTLPTCASAYQARMNSTKFGDAYLVNVDMSGVVANSADFSGAILFGAKFNNAYLHEDSANSSAADFSYAFLQGVDFTGANLQNVNFSSAYVDTDRSNDCMQIKLRNEITGFPGFTSPSASQPVSCVVKGNPSTDPMIPSCISAAYAPNIGPPQTNSTNICPDGVTYTGGCTDAAWATPRITTANSTQPNKTCKARLCNAFTENTCWN